MASTLKRSIPRFLSFRLPKKRLLKSISAPLIEPFDPNTVLDDDSIDEGIAIEDTVSHSLIRLFTWYHFSLYSSWYKFVSFDLLSQSRSCLCLIFHSFSIFIHNRYPSLIAFPSSHESSPVQPCLSRAFHSMITPSTLTRLVPIPRPICFLMPSLGL